MLVPLICILDVQDTEPDKHHSPHYLTTSLRQGETDSGSPWPLARFSLPTSRRASRGSAYGKCKAAS